MINIGVISVSDRAFNKVYEDKGIPEIEKILSVDNDFKISCAPSQFDKIPPWLSITPFGFPVVPDV